MPYLRELVDPGNKECVFLAQYITGAPDAVVSYWPGRAQIPLLCWPKNTAMILPDLSTRTVAVLKSPWCSPAPRYGGLEVGPAGTTRSAWIRLPPIIR